MAGTTGLEPATSDVTGRRSNQLNYVPAMSHGQFDLNMAGAARAKRTAPFQRFRKHEMANGEKPRGDGAWRVLGRLGRV